MNYHGNMKKIPTFTFLILLVVFVSFYFFIKNVSAQELYAANPSNATRETCILNAKENKNISIKEIVDKRSNTINAAKIERKNEIDQDSSLSGKTRKAAVKNSWSKYYTTQNNAYQDYLSERNAVVSKFNSDILNCKK